MSHAYDARKKHLRRESPRPAPTYPNEDKFYPPTRPLVRGVARKLKVRP